MILGFFTSSLSDSVNVLSASDFSTFRHLYSLIFYIEGMNMASVLDFLLF